MKKLNQQQVSSRLFFLLTILSLFYLASCRVAFIPNYNATISKNIETTAKQVDKFYLTMLEKTTEEDGGRNYDKFTEEYVEIEVEINFILNQNKVRPLNKNSTRICEITLELWQKYKKEHKTDNTLSNGLIRLNRKSFSDLFYAMQVAEEGKKIAANPPQ
ncbi:hypothetical protein D1164_19500 [Mariniphaga sediminis]|uniref:Uncharacterized protein n=1 Tax=Mariniphaga sediminis TaxID=1628158 RepID=A0A399CUD3_9BACT|nr:hypothetical protein [Mariniphaga sediminis]RIH63464.1 hypothetical protein D1164_19500 [Mariniphaga sediminis]